jgi:hypothetical protein
MSGTIYVFYYSQIKPDEEAPFDGLIPGAEIAPVDKDLQECDHGENLITCPGLAVESLEIQQMGAEKLYKWSR